MPASHAVQFAVPPAEYRPPVQVSHTAAPISERFPAAQSVHVLSAVAAREYVMYCPKAQANVFAEQLVAELIASVKLPASLESHAMHSLSHVVRPV